MYPTCGRLSISDQRLKKTMPPNNPYKVAYEGSTGSAVEGPDPNFCLELLHAENPAGDTFFLSPDQTTISHLREGVVIDVLRQAVPS